MHQRGKQQHQCCNGGSVSSISNFSTSSADFKAHNARISRLGSRDLFSRMGLAHFMNSRSQ